MLSETKRKKVFTRRAFVLAGVKGALVSSLIGRLYYLQVLKSDEFQTLSDSNRIKLFLLPPERGKILDREGKPLAENRNYYRMLLDPEQVQNMHETLQHFASVLGLDAKAIETLEHKVKAHRSRQPMMLYEHLTWEQVAKIEVNSPDLPGMSIDVGQVRFYPAAHVAPHIIGYLGPVTEEDIAKNPLLNHPDFKVGKSGVEKTLEPQLRGDAGVKKMEVNAFGLSVRELSRVESKPGQDTPLTLHRGVQTYIGEKLQGKSAAVVLIDITQGDVITMISSPGFDPNQFTYGLSAKYWKELMSDPNKPLINKTVTTQYPPGSTFKVINALASLKEGWDPDTHVHCPGYVMLGNRRFNCWKKEGHGSLNLMQAIQQSCNAYFYTTARRIGPDPIAAMARSFGLGALSDIPLPDEKPGIVPDTKWKRERVKEEWQAGDTLNMGIGQGFLLITPLQLAIAAARIASGRKVTPRLVLPLEEAEGATNFLPMTIPAAHLQLVREGMRRVVNVQGGTAYASRIAEGFTFAGKTGTAQVMSRKNVEAGRYLSEEERKLRQHHGLFFGFGPVEKPRYAISVVVEHGGSGSGAAAPVAKETFLALYAALQGEDPKEFIEKLKK